MAEIKWIKITVNMFDDEKIDFIESLPEADAILVIWVKLLTLAGKCNASGFLLLTPTMPYNEEMLAHKFKKPLSTVRFALKTFIELGMVEVGDMGYFISNWEKHQNEDKMAAIREHNRVKKQLQRQRKKLLLSDNVPDVSGTSPGLSPGCPHTEVERDKEADKEYTSSTETYSSDYVALLDYYSAVTGVLLPSPNDIALAKQLVDVEKIPLDIIKSAINEKIDKYKPKHKQDKIRCLSYFEGKIRDMWAIEQAKAVNNQDGHAEYIGTNRTAQGVGQKQFDTSAIGFKATGVIDDEGLM